MDTFIGKSKENNIQSVANNISKGQSERKFAFQFVDNRPKTVIQRKQGGIANNNSRAKKDIQLQKAMDDYSIQQQKQFYQSNTGDNVKPIQLMLRRTVGAGVVGAVTPRLLASSQRRPVSFHANPTTFHVDPTTQKPSKVKDPGHIWIQFSQEEIKQLQGSPLLGPSGQVGFSGDPKSRTYSSAGNAHQVMIQDENNTGHRNPIGVGALHRPGKGDWEKEKPIATTEGHLSTDFGTLSGAQLRILEEYCLEAVKKSAYRTDVVIGPRDPSKSEKHFKKTKGGPDIPDHITQTMNCVGFVEGAAKKIGLPLDELHPNTTPQELFEKIAGLKKSESPT